MKWVRIGMLISILVLFWTWRQWPGERLRLVFCDVGQGDASLVILGSFQILVDTGPSWSSLSQCLQENMPFWDREIEVVVNSHPQKDHWGAFSFLEKNYQLDRVMMATNSATGDIVRYGELSLEIVSGGEKGQFLREMSSSEENEASLVGLLRWGGVRVLYTGDIGSSTELALLQAGLLEKLTVLKVAHHGSKYSSVEAFLEKVRPKLAVVSVGSKNSYGHPNGDVLTRLDAVGAVVRRTDLTGEVGLECGSEGNCELK